MGASTGLGRCLCQDPKEQQRVLDGHQQLFHTSLQLVSLLGHCLLAPLCARGKYII